MVERVATCLVTLLKPLRDEIILATLSVRPMRREDLVSLAPEQQLEWLAEHFIDRLTEHLVHVGHHPATQLEVSCRIFFRATWCLHHAVQRHHGSCDDLSHFCPPLVRQDTRWPHTRNDNSTY